MEDCETWGYLFGEICMMRPEQDIISVITSLQSIAATCDVRLDIKSEIDSPMRRVEITNLRAQCLLQIKILEWVLGREPSL
jgi:hypothetical protein